MDLRVAAYAVIERRGKILLTHWRRGHLHGWTLPGGGIDPGEDPKDAVVREVDEETGLTAKVGKLLGVDSRVMIREEVPEGTPPELHTIRIVYRASVADGPLRHEVGGSSDEARWVAIKDLGSLKTLSLVQTGLRMAGISRRSGQGAGKADGGRSGGGRSGGRRGATKQGGARQGARKQGAGDQNPGKQPAGKQTSGKQTPGKQAPSKQAPSKQSPGKLDSAQQPARGQGASTQEGGAQRGGTPGAAQPSGQKRSRRAQSAPRPDARA